MNLIPSMDLMNGKVVRLIKGNFDEMTVYEDDPISCMEALIKSGANTVHIVDLDATRLKDESKVSKFKSQEVNDSMNQNVILQLIAAFKGKVTLQLGGGIRSYSSASQWFTHGIDRVVVGTLFFKPDTAYEQLVRDYPSKVVLALDVKENEICHTGWQLGSGQSIDDVVSSGKVGNIHSILVTDIDVDGTLAGPNFKLLERLGDYPIMASGAISCEADVDRIKRLGIKNAVIGKAYYEGRVKRLGNI